MLRRLSKCLLPLLLVAVWTSDAAAQTPTGLSTGFQRDINRYRWTSGFRFERQVGSWRASVRNDYLSEAFLLGESLSDFRDEELGVWSLSRNIAPELEARLSGQLTWYSLSNALTNSTYAGMRITPTESVVFEPALGLAIDRRPTEVQPDGSVSLRTDAGPALSYSAAYRPTAAGDYRLQIASSGNWQIIRPRRSRNFETTALVGRTFNRTDVQIESGYVNVRRDSYQSASFLNRDAAGGRTPQTIEATTNDTLVTRLSMQRPMARGFRVESRVDFSTHRRFVRTLRTPSDALFFDTDFKRRIVDAEVALGYNRGVDAGRIAIQTGATVERRQLANRASLPPTQATLKGSLLRQADFDRGFFSLAGSWQASPFKRFSFQASASAHVVRRDTPEENNDDRDELYQNGQLGILVRLSRYVEADLRAIGTMYHTVYIRSTRSGENNRQRALRFRPGLRWTPSAQTSIRFQSEVRATYTVDDFEISGRPRNDQSARERRYELEVDHRLGHGARLLFDGRVSELHLGRLIWTRFAEIPFDTLRTWGAWGRLVVGQKWTAEIGGRVFVRRDFDNRTTISYDRLLADGSVALDSQGIPLRDTISRPGREWIEQFGPTCAVAWFMRSGSIIRLDGWIQVQRIRQHLFGQLPPDDSNRILASGRKGRTRIIPNLSIDVAWRF